MESRLDQYLNANASDLNKDEIESESGCMKGLRLEVSCPLCTFRVPFNTACVETYPFPPKTTAIGMLGAALGWDEPFFLSCIKRIKYGVLIKSPGEINKETVVYYKSYDNEDAEFELPSPKPGKKPHRMTRSPAVRYFLRRPRWVLYFASEDSELIESSYRALSDPKYPITLSDSESLFYPERTDFLMLFQRINPTKTRHVRSVLPKNVIKGKIRIGECDKEVRSFLFPKEYLVPVDFTKEGRSRRAIYMSLVAFSGYEILLENDIEVYRYGDEEVYLF